MNKTLRSFLFVTPRMLAILFILLISVFALDMFSMNMSFWKTVMGMFMHLLPSIAIVIALAIVWRWEWIGAAFFLAVSGWFLYISTPGDAMYYIVFVGVPLSIAVLFLAGWFSRKMIQKQQETDHFRL